MPEPHRPAAKASDPEALSSHERQALWTLHRLHEPTFDDLTKGLCLGLLWCMVLWAPMFLSALT